MFILNKDLLSRPVNFYESPLPCQVIAAATLEKSHLP
jgi:hypothetical protein